MAEAFPALVKERLQAIYGDRLVGLVLFGGRARGDHAPDSDRDFEVVLRGPVDRWSEWDVLSDLEFELRDRTGQWARFMPRDTERERHGLLGAAIRMEGVPV